LGGLEHAVKKRPPQGFLREEEKKNICQNPGQERRGVSQAETEKKGGKKKVQRE